MQIKQKMQRTSNTQKMQKMLTKAKSIHTCILLTFYMTRFQTVSVLLQFGVTAAAAGISIT